MEFIGIVMSSKEYNELDEELCSQNIIRYDNQTGQNTIELDIQQLS